MEERDKPTESNEDVEAHRRKSAVSAADEPQAEGESDDVEAHRKKSAVSATDEPQAEGDSDDDVELHRRVKPQ